MPDSVASSDEQVMTFGYRMDDGLVSGGAQTSAAAGKIELWNDADCVSKGGAHVRGFPEYGFLIKRLSIFVDHRPDCLSRHFRIGMHHQQYLCPLMTDFSLISAPLSLGVPHCESVRKSR